MSDGETPRTGGHWELFDSTCASRPVGGPVGKLYWRCLYCGAVSEYIGPGAAREHLATQHADRVAEWEPYLRWGR